MIGSRTALVALCLISAASTQLSAQDAGSQLIVSTLPTGLQVRVDGEARGVSPVRVPSLLPGSHLVEAILPSGEIITRVVELGANSSQVVELSAAPVQSEAARLAPPPSPATAPVVPAPPVAAPVAPVTAVPATAGTDRGVHLRLVSEPEGLRLNFHAGSSFHNAGNMMLAINSWDPVCSAPCEQRIEPGHYRAAVSDLDGDYYPVSGGLDLTQDRSMRLSIDYRRGPRAAGWIMAIVGYGMMFGSLAMISNDDLTPMLVLLCGGGVIGLTGQMMAMLIRPRGIVEF